jgi:hypothetical protein
MGDIVPFQPGAATSTTRPLRHCSVDSEWRTIRPQGGHQDIYRYGFIKFPKNQLGTTPATYRYNPNQIQLGLPRNL